MKKKFDCIEMKRKVQEEIYEEIKNLSHEEEVGYFHRAAGKFWKEISMLKKKSAKRKPSTKKESVKG